MILNLSSLIHYSLPWAMSIRVRFSSMHLRKVLVHPKHFASSLLFCLFLL